MFILTPDQWLSVGKGGLLAMGGALVVYMGADVLPLLNESGPAGAAVGAAAAVLINVARKKFFPEP